MNVEHRRASISAGEIAYLDLGEGPALVMLHGFPTSSFLWRRDALLLAARMRVIAPDLLGYGKSAKPSDVDLGIEAQARYVRELVDLLGVGEFAVVGHGVGGGVAQLLALDGSVPALVLLDSICFDAWPSGDVRRLQAVGPEEQTAAAADAFVRAMLDGAFAHKERLDEATVRAYATPWQEDPSALFRAAMALGGAGLAGREGDLSALDVSTFVIWGEDDPYLPSDLAERLGEMMPGSTVALLPGCSHLVNEDAPQTVGPLIHEFLRYRYLGESHGPTNTASVPVSLERPSDDALLVATDQDP